MRILPGLLLLGALFASQGAFSAEKQLFDLVGPGVDIIVTRGGVSLPLAQVPGLAAGDRLRLKPVLPAGDAARYVMVTAFLRGSTNPPPDDWFKRCDTWRRDCLDKGLDLEVPKDAVQMVLLFAPKTGGDFKTLMRTVQGRPGAFVRASQELFQFSLDRVRLERYVSELGDIGATQPDRVKEVAPLLAQLALEVAVLARGIGAAAYALDEVTLVERLDEVVVDAKLDGPHRVVVRGLAGDEDGSGRRAQLAQAGEGLDPIHAGHAHPTDHEVEGCFTCALDRLVP